MNYDVTYNCNDGAGVRLWASCDSLGMAYIQEALCFKDKQVNAVSVAIMDAAQQVVGGVWRK